MIVACRSVTVVKIGALEIQIRDKRREQVRIISEKVFFSLLFAVDIVAGGVYGYEEKDQTHNLFTHFSNSNLSG